MRLRTGTSGFSYDEWHGGFYPADLPAAERLSFYGSRLPTVEINNTFYQMPKPELLARWRDMVPADFRFALKAPRRITHVLRLKDAREPVERFLTVAATLGERLGPLLFQLPPFARMDAALLGDFLALLPAGQRVAFEFRHPSWFDEAIYELLRAHDAALCVGDSDDGARSPPLVATARWGYLRLRAPSYDARGLGAWSERIVSQPWDEAYAYLKHEVNGPAYAAYLDAVAVGRGAPPLPESEPGLVPARRERKKRSRSAAATAPTPERPAETAKNAKRTAPKPAVGTATEKPARSKGPRATQKAAARPARGSR